MQPALTLASTRATGSGVVLGKFLPPHLGHVHLVDFARHYVDDLTVLVGTLAREPIPGILRYQWMRELFPTTRVVHLSDENPQHPHEHPDFWDIWRDSMLSRLERPPDYLFASEDYGDKLAQVLGATYVPVDKARAMVPVSGTAVRRDPWGQWSYLPEPVRAHFVGRVCVFGPESTGKSTLTARLAEHYKTVGVPEYARTVLEARQGPVTAVDIERIARGQQASEDALARRANRLLFCDTDLLTTTLWSEALIGDCPEWIAHEAAQRRYDLTLLLDVDVPYTPDPIRYLPDARASFFARCERALLGAKRPYVILRGGFDARFEAAIAAVDDMIARNPRAC